MKDLWKAFKRLPLVSKRFNKKAQSMRFLDLPEDIVYEIIEHLDVRALCALSLTCHGLYLALLSPHLRRLGIDDPFTEIHLHGENSTESLPALRLLLFSTSLPTFTWRAGKDPRTLVREVEQLRRLVARIPSIDFMELDFSNNWPVHEFRYGHENGYWAWIRVCTNLLHVVAQKCSFLVITNHYQVLIPWLTFIGGIPYNLDPALLERICKEWLNRSRGSRITSPSKISLSRYHTSHRPAFPPAFPPGKVTPGYTIERLVINDPALFQRSLFGEWAVNWVNKMPLTHIVVHQGRMRLPLLRQLRLPNLVHLTISHGYGISTSDIINLLGNNESLTSIDCYGTKLDVSTAVMKKRKPRHPTTDPGLSVERLAGTSSFLSKMLDLEITFPHLTTISIQLRSDSPFEQSNLYRLYNSVSQRRTIINVIFEVPPAHDSRNSFFHNWLRATHSAASVKANSEAIGCMDCVRSVQVHSYKFSRPQSTVNVDDDDDSTPAAATATDGVSPIPDHELDTGTGTDTDLGALLATWISCFPRLEEVNFRYVFASQEPEYTRTCVDKISAVSSRVTVRIDGTVWHCASIFSRAKR